MHGLATQMVLKWARFGSERPICCTDDFTKLTLDTIALCSMGTRFNSFYRDDVHPFAKAMTAVLLESGRRSSRSKITNMLARAANKEFFANIDIMQSVTKAIINDRKINPTDNNDLVNAMLTRKDPLTGELMTESNISNNMITFLVAGEFSTSGNTPEIMLKRLQATRRLLASSPFFSTDSWSTLRHLRWHRKK